MIQTASGPKGGFTIVELLIVIVVIAILAVITVVAFNGVQTRATTSLIQSELSQNYKSLQSYYVVNNDTYPADLGTSGIKVSENSAVSYEPAGDQKSFCLHIVNNGQVYSVSSSNNNPTNNFCSGVTPTLGTLASTSFTVTWTAISGASSYNSQCARDAGYSVGLVSDATSSLSSNFTGLQAGTTYYCRVQAVLGSTNGPWSVDGTGSTAAPAVPTGLAGSSATSTSFTTSWTSVPGVIGYTVQCARNTTYTTGLVTQNPSGTSQSFTGLQAGTTHYCHVLSRGGSVNSAYSANLTYSTSAPAVPGSLSSSSITNSSFTFSWGAVSGVVGYTAQCATDTGYTTNLVTNSTIPAGTTSYNVTGRAAGTANYCRVLSRGGTTNSANSANLTITTLP